MNHWTKAAVLSLLLLVCGSGFVLTQRVREQIPPPAPHDLFATVNQQLIAFRSADFQTAYRGAATVVKQKFTLTQFERMVREQYPAMAHVQRVEFGSVRAEGSSAVVQVFFLAANGGVRSFLYSLTYEDETWRIDGVEELDGFRSSNRLVGTHA